MIKLRALNRLHVTPFYDWLNDEDCIRYSLSAFQKINTKEDVDSWFNDILEDNKNLSLGIFLNDGEQLIGYAGICNISNSNKSENTLFSSEINRSGEKGLELKSLNKF